MFFLALAVFGPLAWFLPWWSAMLAGFLLGTLAPHGARAFLQLNLGAATAWMAVSYLADARSFGRISLRLAGLFGLPSPWLCFVLMGVMGAVTAGLGYGSGVTLRNLVWLRRSTSRASFRSGEFHRTGE